MNNKKEKFRSLNNVIINNLLDSCSKNSMEITKELGISIEQDDRIRKKCKKLVDKGLLKETEIINKTANDAKRPCKYYSLNKEMFAEALVEDIIYNDGFDLHIGGIDEEVTKLVVKVIESSEFKEEFKKYGNNGTGKMIPFLLDRKSV